MRDRPRIVVWADLDRLGLVRDVVELAGVDVAAIGADRSTDATTMAEALGAERVGDVRTALQRADADLLWLAALDRLDASERRLVREASRPVLSTVPRPGALADILADPAEGRTATTVPLMRNAPGFAAAREVLEQFGAVHAAAITLRSARVEAPLFAKVFDAVDLLLLLGLEVRSVDAALQGPFHEAPETLPALAGRLTAHLRGGREGGAVIVADDTGGAWHRGATILGDGGSLRVTDRHLEWLDPSGERVESIEAEPPPCPDPAPLIAASIRRHLDARTTPEPPADTAERLALCEAIRLSCRTGDGESPLRVLEAMGRI